MTFSIRRIDAKTPGHHIEAIAQMIWEEWSAHYTSKHELLAEINACQKEGSPSHIFYALGGGPVDQVLGTIGLLKNVIHKYAHLTPWLANFYTAPELWGKGIGRALYKELIRFAFLTVNYPKIYLYTSNPEPYHVKGWRTLDQFEYLNQTEYCLVLDAKEAMTLYP